MTLPQNVEDAVTKLQRKAFAFDAMVAANRISEDLEAKSLALADGPIETLAAATIRAHLMSQEAEIARLNAEWHEIFNRALLAESRLAAANSLLREALQYHGVMLMSDPPQDAWKYHRMNERITANLSHHLQGAGDEA